MTKSELIKTVARRAPHISKKDVELVVDTLFGSMAQALKRGKRIQIRGFGSFQVKVLEAREGRNPRTGKPLHVPARRRPFFRVGKELKERIGGVALPSPRGPSADAESRRHRG
jgi:integration host factor subunit beta